MSTTNRMLHYNDTDFPSETFAVSKPHTSAATKTSTSYDRSGSSSTSSAKVSPARSSPKYTGRCRREDGPAQHKEDLPERDYRSGYDRTSNPMQNVNYTESPESCEVDKYYVGLQAMIEECSKACILAMRDILELHLEDIQRKCEHHFGLRAKNICTVESHAQLFEKKQEQFKIIKKLRRENQELLDKIAALEYRYNNLEKRSRELTKQMALKTEYSETLENVNDEFSNFSIVHRLERLYDVDWANLYRLLSRSVPREMSELDKISLLSSLIKLSYDKCSKLGNRYLRTLFCLKEDERLPVRSNELMAPLRRICQSQFVRERIREKILLTLLATDESNWLNREDNTNEVNRKFLDFFGELIDCLWLVATVSSPAMILNFDVVGKRFRTLQNSWRQYTTKKPVEDLSQYEGTIVLVVWPSVEIKGQSSFYTRGDAVVVTTGRNLRKVRHESARPPRHNPSTSDPQEINAMLENMHLYSF